MQCVKDKEDHEAKLRETVYDVASKHGYQVETDNYGQLVLYTGVLHQAWQYCPQCLGIDFGSDCDNTECEDGVVYVGRNSQ